MSVTQSCVGCGRLLPARYARFQVDASFRLWVREGFCSYICFREKAQPQLVEKHQAQENTCFERDVHRGKMVQARAPAARREPFALGGVPARILARLVDVALAWVVLAVILGLWVPRPAILFTAPTGPGAFFFEGHPFATAPGRAILSLLVGTVVYFAVCHRVSATPLKALFRLRVVTEGGRPGSCVRNSVREVLVFFDIVFAGVVAFVCMSMTDQRQRLGDMIARTLVVRSDEPFWLLLGRACAISAACLVVWSGLMRLLWL